MSNVPNRNATRHATGHESSHAGLPQLESAGISSLPRLLAAYADTLREMGPLLARPWCIQATRIAQQVFASFGVSVDPVITSVVCSNAMRRAQLGQWWVPIVQGQRPAEARCGHMQQWDCPPSSELWYGHLVPLVGGRYLLDAAISQNQQAASGILTPDVLVQEVDSFREEGDEVRIEHVADGVTTEIIYYRRAADVSFQRLEGWRSRDNHVIARDLACEIRRRLDYDIALSHGIVRAGVGAQRVDPMRRAS